jgi:hypothetical protein
MSPTIVGINGLVLFREKHARKAGIAPGLGRRTLA